MTECERRQEAYARRELGEEEAFAFDTHVLDCDSCWAAVHEERQGALLAQSLRSPAPWYLAERIRFAVGALAREDEVDTHDDAVDELLGSPSNFRHPRRRRSRPRVRRMLAALAITPVAVATALWGVGTMGGRSHTSPAHTSPAHTSPAADQIVAMMRTLATAPAGSGTGSGVSLVTPEGGARLRLTVDGQPMRITRYRVGDSDVVTAISPRPFPVPSHVTMVTSGSSSMAWMTLSEGVTVYCVSSQRVLFASRGGVAAILAAARALHLT